MRRPSHAAVQSTKRPTCAIEDSCATPCKVRRRIRIKGPELNAPIIPAVAAVPSTAKHRGHYDVMGISRTASAEQIRNAFKSGALKKHPDKGGSASQWNLLWDAWVILSNATRRTIYDAQLASSGSLDGITQPHTQEADARPDHPNILLGRARKFLERFLWGLVNDSELKDTLHAWSLSRCLALRTLMRHQSNTNLESDLVIESNTKHEVGSIKGICRHSKHYSYYKIYAQWKGFRVECMTKSLTHALDFHIALMDLREIALARTQVQEGRILTFEELLATLNSQPLMHLKFWRILERFNRQFRTPQFHDFRLAEKHGKKLLSCKTIAAATRARRSADLDLEKEQKLRTQRLCKLQEQLEVVIVQYAQNVEKSETELKMHRVLSSVLGLAPEDAEQLGRRLSSLTSGELHQRLAALRAPPGVQILEGPRLLALPSSSSRNQTVAGPTDVNLWPVKCDKSTCCRIMRHLSLRDLAAFQVASYTAKCTRDVTVWDQLQNFTYIPGSAVIGLVPPRSSGGRRKWAATSGIAQRMFFQHFLSLHAEWFGKYPATCLDLSLAMASVLELSAIKKLFLHMRKLKEVVLPRCGWSSPIARRHAKEAFHPSVRVVFR